MTFTERWLQMLLKNFTILIKALPVSQCGAFLAHLAGKSCQEMETWEGIMGMTDRQSDTWHGQLLSSL
jgi:hypothetical protein